MGQTFAADADQPDRERTALISERLWRSRYAARTDILGRSIVLDGQPVAVIGVMPSSFRFVFPDADVWRILPLTPPTRRGPFILRGIARLKPGVTLAEVNVEMAGLAQGVERADPKKLERLRYPVVGLTETIVGGVPPLLVALAAAVALVLLIAVLNVGNLLLARAAAREEEIAIRLKHWRRAQAFDSTVAHGKHRTSPRRRRHWGLRRFHLHPIVARKSASRHTATGEFKH